MNLRRLKKQLKKQQKERAKRSKFRFYLGILLALTVFVVAGLPMYRHYQQSAPQRLLDAAAELESQGKFEAAQQQYQQLYQRYPDSALAPQALLQCGQIWQLERHHDQQALLSYLQLEHDYPESQLVRPAREQAARIVKYSLRDYSRAIEFYQRLLEDAGDKADQYLYEIADCYFRLDNYTQARIELETLIERVPHSPLLPDVLYRKGGLLLLENRLEAARQDWQQLIKEFPHSVYAPQARFNLAKLLEEQGRLVEALKQYQQLTDYPQPALLEEKIKHLKQRIETKKKAI